MNIFVGNVISADMFWGMADITYVVRVNTRCWGPTYVADKIQSTHPRSSAASDLDLRCLPLILQVLDTSTGSITDLA